MKKIDKCLLGIYALFYIALGVLFVLLEGGYIVREDLNRIMLGLHMSLEEPLFRIIWWSSLVLSGISILNILFVHRPRKQAVLLKTERGEVDVALAAIEEYIRRTVLMIKEVKDIKTKVFVRPRGIRVKTKIALRSDIGISNIVGKIQSDVEKSVKHMLGLDLRVVVDVNVTKMTSSGNVVPILEPEVPESEEKENKQVSPYQGIEY